VRALWRTTGRYIDFWDIARDALRYAAKYYRMHLEEDELTGILEGYFQLAPFSDVQEGLQNLAGYRKAILSNGTRKMLLNALENSGFDNDFVSVIRSEDARSYKVSCRLPISRRKTELCQRKDPVRIV